jgi:hypothetical protein
VPTFSPTKTLTPVPTALPTKQPTARPTQVPSETLKITAVSPVPNPNPTIFYVNLSGMADYIDLQVYSSSNVLVVSQTSGQHYMGWTIVYLPQSFLGSASNGTYAYVLTARRGGAVSAPAKGVMAFFR